MKKKKTKTFEHTTEFANFIDSLGGHLWLVGGAVRDSFLGINSNDEDYVVTGIDITDMPFEKVVGDDFPVFLVEIGGKKCEVAMARKEKKDGVGYKGFTFFTGKDVTIHDDLARRDLTMNAIAIHMQKCCIPDDVSAVVDPFGGEKDIESRILRHTTEAFEEDPLRVYRTARFAAQLGFDIDMHTLVLMHNMKKQLETLTPERVWIEFEKVLKTPNPRRFFEVLKSIDVLDVHFKEVAALNVFDKHDGTAFNHTMNILTFSDTPLMRFGALVHDFGKGCTPKEIHPAHHGHGKMGEKPVNDFCDRLKIPNEFRNFGVFCAKHHMRIKTIQEMRPGKLLRWILNNKKFIKSLMHLSSLDSIYREGAQYLDILIWLDYAEDIIDKAFEIEATITGKQLIEEGYEEGPNLGGALFQRRVDAFKIYREGRTYG